MILGVGRLTLLICADLSMAVVIYGFSTYVVNQSSSPLEILLPMLVVGPFLGGFGAIAVNATIDEIYSIGSIEGDAE